MKTNTLLITVLAAGLVVAAEAQNKTAINIEYPKPQFSGTPPDIKKHTRFDTYPHENPRPPIEVPVGCDKVLSRDCRVTSSDPSPLCGELSYITDGEKEWDASTYVELAPGLQWVQIDLGKACEIYAACVWHCFRQGRVYRAVICQISNDPDFIDDVVTVFNNDYQNLAKLGEGKDKEYLESNYGRPFAIRAVKGRYVRFYSKGNTSNQTNHYVEIEVYGKGASPDGE